MPNNLVLKFTQIPKVLNDTKVPDVGRPKNFTK